ncbi:MAG: F0F1 ATP synthase subunit B [Lachnospira sp.]|nr:F0F1 ATP synthase subunit B [Lachnospira sp.]
MLELHLLTVVLNIVNVLVFFAIIRAFLWKPIMGVMEKRQQMIDDDLNAAKEQNEQAAKLKADYEEALSEAKSEAEEIIEKARKSSSAEHDAAVAKTQEETAKMIAEAKASIEVERSKAMKSVQAEIAGIAMAAAQKVVGNNLDEDANKKYLDEFLNEAGGK